MNALCYRISVKQMKLIVAIWKLHESLIDAKKCDNLFESYFVFFNHSIRRFGLFVWKTLRLIFSDFFKVFRIIPFLKLCWISLLSLYDCYDELQFLTILRTNARFEVSKFSFQNQLFQTVLLNTVVALLCNKYETEFNRYFRCCL